MSEKPSAPAGERLTEEEMAAALVMAEEQVRDGLLLSVRLISRALIQLKAECDADHPPEEAYLAWCEGADTDVVIALTRRLAERDALLRRAVEVLRQEHSTAEPLGRTCEEWGYDNCEPCPYCLLLASISAQLGKEPAAPPPTRGRADEMSDIGE